MKTSDFDYALPEELIAQTPIEPRDASRLLVLDRASGTIRHRMFADIADFLLPGDVLVMNDSRVIPARLTGRKAATGGKVELLLLKKIDDGSWQALVKPAKRVRVGTIMDISRNGSGGAEAQVIGEAEDGIKTVRFQSGVPLPELGEIPLPPYIHARLADPERYQTVYAREKGSVAAPTAGLHFTPELLRSLEIKGVECLFVTLHVSLDTFRPVREENPLEHRLHSEYGVVTPEVAKTVNAAMKEGRRVVCVGTTTVRLLEQAVWDSQPGEVSPFAGRVDIFILPGHRFGITGAMLTNFHLPRSTLLMLVSAFGGSDFIRRGYQAAIEQKYRFYSFGDAMLII